MTRTEEALAAAFAKLGVSPNGHRPTGAPLPDGFWDERDHLVHIRQAAHSRNRSATAVLHVVLARVSAFTPHTVQLPAIVGSAVPLCYFANLAGASGTGKSGANDIGTELIPAPERARDQLRVGSGQGLIEIFFETVEEEDSNGKVQRVKRQTYYNAYVYVDEGRVLADLGTTSNSILLPTLRSIWTGGTLGNTNASDERRRILPGGQYAYGVVLAIQDRLAGPLLEDTASGTPQRFAWADASDPSIPDVAPDWPDGRLWTPPTLTDLADIERRGAYVRHQLEVAGPIVTEIQDADRARARGHLVPDELDAHAGLVQLKVAALLAVLDRRAEVTTDDWELAAAIKADSDATRARVLASIAAEADEREAATSQRLARRQVAAADVAEAHRLTKNVDLARVLAAKVWGQTDEWTGSALRRSLPSRDRGYYAAALEHAESEEWVTVSEEPSHTGDVKQVVRRGARRPS
jgi:hypothetical protein